MIPYGAARAQAQRATAQTTNVSWRVRLATWAGQGKAGQADTCGRVGRIPFVRGGYVRMRAYAPVGMGAVPLT